MNEIKDMNDPSLKVGDTVKMKYAPKYNYGLYERMLNIVRRAANTSCCLCRDECLSCDASDILKEFGIDR
jgi:hypothetical protein